jgi:amino-acid N-acetyltransferase
MFTLRDAKRDDASAIRSLVRSARINPSGLKWARFVVAVDSHGDVIGCGQVKPHRDGSRELASLVVAPDWRGRGVARAIMGRLLNTHPGEVYLMCRSGLGAFYEKFGFEAIDHDEMPPYFRRVSRLVRLMAFLMRDGETLLVMVRRLGREPPRTAGADGGSKREP